ncbi:unnamed protein product, partial [Didymodactylos carnosus]
MLIPASQIFIEHSSAANILIDLLSDIAAHLQQYLSNGLIEKFDLRYKCWAFLKNHHSYSSIEKTDKMDKNIVDYFLHILLNSIGVFASQDENIYGFLYSSFQEYFTCLFLIQLSNENDEEISRIDLEKNRFLHYITNPTFRDPLLLALESIIDYGQDSGGNDLFVIDRLLTTISIINPNLCVQRSVKQDNIDIKTLPPILLVILIALHGGLYRFNQPDSDNKVTVIFSLSHMHRDCSQSSWLINYLNANNLTHLPDIQNIEEQISKISCEDDSPETIDLFMIWLCVTHFEEYQWKNCFLGFLFNDEIVKENTLHTELFDERRRAGEVQNITGNNIHFYQISISLTVLCAALYEEGYQPHESADEIMLTVRLITEPILRLHTLTMIWQFSQGYTMENNILDWISVEALNALSAEHLLSVNSYTLL